MNLDRAIQAAGEAFNQYASDNPGSMYDDTPQIAARIAVEAAAPILLQYTGSLHQIAQQRAERAEILVEEWVENKKDWVERAERAEGEVKQLRTAIYGTDWQSRALRAEAEVERLLGLGKIVEAEMERLHRVVETGQFVWREAAERAEAEVERLRGLVVEKAVEMEQQWNRAEDRAALADELAEALRLGGEHEGPCDPDSEWEGCDIHYRTSQQRRNAALTHYEEARREV